MYVFLAIWPDVRRYVRGSTTRKYSPARAPCRGSTPFQPHRAGSGRAERRCLYYLLFVPARASVFHSPGAAGLRHSRRLSRRVLPRPAATPPPPRPPRHGRARAPRLCHVRARARPMEQFLTRGSAVQKVRGGPRQAKLEVRGPSPPPP